MKALNQWARYYGYNDFDTFIRAGGSLRDAASDIRHRIQTLHEALAEIRPLMPLTSMRQDTGPTVEPEELARVEQEPHDEPPETDNAQVQGAELG